MRTMRYHLAYADGAPSRTAVLDVSDHDDDVSSLESHVRKLARRLGHAELITKYALLRPAQHPLFDLEYRFAQAIPAGNRLRVDWSGNCGHSILASVAVAGHWHWMAKPAPGAKTRVEVLNTGAVVITEAVRCEADRLRFTAHFPQERGTKAQSLLLTGEPRTVLAGGAEVSLVAAGNPYAFVDARQLGITSPDQLFAARDELFDLLEGIRREAAALVGSRSPVLPKICCVGAFGGVLAARSISVPSFHPTLALTGLVALGAAAVIPGTVVNECVRETGGKPTSLTVLTANSKVRVHSLVRGSGTDLRLECVSVPNKRVWLGGRSARHFKALTEQHRSALQTFT